MQFFTRITALSLLAALLLVSATPSYAELYQWRDEHGRVHFGDRAPEEQEVKTVNIEAKPEREQLKLEVFPEGFALNTGSMNVLQEKIPAILKIYRQLFRLDLNKTVEVKITLLPDKASFNRWMAERTGNPKPTNALGAYLTQSREVGVWNHGSQEEVLRTILHESSHVVMAQVSPYAPSWLQEGMAEYFETLSKENGKYVVRPIPESAARIQYWQESKQLISLRSYLSIPEAKWRTMAHNANPMPYTVAWATAYFMLSSETGKNTLRRVLHDMEKSRRWPSVDDLESRYPGGLTRMDYEFFKWTQSEMPAHQYSL